MVNPRGRDRKERLRSRGTREVADSSLASCGFTSKDSATRARQKFQSGPDPDIRQTWTVEGKRGSPFRGKHRYPHPITRLQKDSDLRSKAMLEFSQKNPTRFPTASSLFHVNTVKGRAGQGPSIMQHPDSNPGAAPAMYPWASSLTFFSFL